MKRKIILLSHLILSILFSSYYLNSDKLKVVSSFFPIDEFVKKIGGDSIKSSLLIPAAIEPHDFESTINQIQTVDSADVLVYNGLGIENWIAKINTAYKIDAGNGLDVSYVDKRI
jgi:zinc transport system substrate-binding protein